MYNRWIYVNFIQKYIHTEQFPCYIKWIFILLQNYEYIYNHDWSRQWNEEMNKLPF